MALSISQRSFPGGLTGRYWALAAFLAAWAVVGPLDGARAAEDRGPKVDVTLLADQTAVVPGGTVRLVVQFKIQDKWHIYWRNAGDSGLPPSVDWTLPDGYQVGELKFPIPERQVLPGDLQTYNLEHEPALLTELKVPKAAEAGSEVTLKGDVSWFVCDKDRCLAQEGKVELSLPVVASAAEVKPANEIDFKLADRALPHPADKAAPYLKKVSVRASVDRVKPDLEFDLAVIVEPAEGMHLNANPVLDPAFIPTEVFEDQGKGYFIGRAIYPKGEIERMPGLDTPLSVYRGKTVIMLPVKTSGKLETEKIRLSGIVAYQACDDKTKQCFPVTAAEWSIELPVAAADAEIKSVDLGPSNSGAEDPGPDVTDNSAQASTGDGVGEGARAGGGFTLDSDLSVTLQQEEKPFLVWLGFAFLAGLILNVTPCVLPVISIKVLSFVQQASESPAKVFKLGLAFSAGMLLVFNGLAILATVVGLVWGQHFQSSVFTVGMAAIVFAFGLSLFGVFTLGVPRSVGTLAAKAESGGEGYTASVAKGALATVMGTPCLGPFLGSVLGWVASQPPAIAFLVFNVMGIGMAFPYLVLTANPKWLRFVPKAGPWLTTFKQAMAFLLMGTVVYFLVIIESQLGGSGVVWTVAFLGVIGVACWLFGTFATFNSSPGRRVVIMTSSLATVALGGWLTLGMAMEPNPRGSDDRQIVREEPDDKDVIPEKLPWEPFSLARLEELTAEGKTVFLDITASWCPNCLVNKKVVFDTRPVAEVVRKHNVVPMLADWSKDDPEIERLIEKLTPGGSIPLCVVFPGDRPTQPIVMAGIVTPSQVIDALEKGATAMSVVAADKD